MQDQLGLSIRQVAPTDVERLAAFLAEIARDPEARYFHPHPMTRDAARGLCEGAGVRKDRYSLALHQSTVLAYSMLRGWDEGFEIPSFGGCVSPAFRGLGLGRWVLVRAMSDSRALGAKKLRLTVYKDNRSAVELYRELGFTYASKNDAELIGFADLTGALPACDESLVAKRVVTRIESLRRSAAVA